MRWWVYSLNNARREDLTFIAVQFWLFFISFVAVSRYYLLEIVFFANFSRVDPLWFHSPHVSGISFGLTSPSNNPIAWLFFALVPWWRAGLRTLCGAQITSTRPSTSWSSIQGHHAESISLQITSTWGSRTKWVHPSMPRLSKLINIIFIILDPWLGFELYGISSLLVSLV